MDYGNQQSSRCPWIRLASPRANRDSLKREGRSAGRKPTTGAPPFRHATCVASRSHGSQTTSWAENQSA
jgi:hypothetical protein